VDWSTLDRIAAVVIMPALLKMGWNLMANAMRALLDASLDLETLQQDRPAGCCQSNP
jgi:divalent metal cation (Fe/Co/Zn/Cd) transporter